MANILVLGVDPESTYALARSAIASGHHACVALSREQAFRKILSGLIDTLLCDTVLAPTTQAEIFRQLRRAVPALPRLVPAGAELPAASRRVAAAVLPRRRVEMTEPLMRAVAYLFGVIEGKRLGVPTDVEIRCDGVTRFGALTTAFKGREAILEFLDPEAEHGLMGITLLGPNVPATVKVHFPGGGVLRIAGTVEAAVSRRGIVSLKLTAAPEALTAPAVADPAAPTAAAGLFAHALLSA